MLPKYSYGQGRGLLSSDTILPRTCAPQKLRSQSTRTRQNHTACPATSLSNPQGSWASGSVRRAVPASIFRRSGGRDYHRHGHTSASRTASRRFASITRIEGIVTRIGDPAWKGAISRDACSCTTTKIKRKVLPKVRHPTNENAPDSVKSWDAR